MRFIDKIRDIFTYKEYRDDQGRWIKLWPRTGAEYFDGSARYYLSGEMLVRGSYDFVLHKDEVYSDKACVKKLDAKKTAAVVAFVKHALESKGFKIEVA